MTEHPPRTRTATSRARLIATVLHQPSLQRPLLGHELRGRMVQSIGPGSTTVDWSASVPQLAEAIDVALVEAEQRGEKDTRRGRQPRPGGSTARAELLAVLHDAGYNTAAARDLIGRAFREPHSPHPDREVTESLAGGHALVVEYEGLDLLGSCQCGRRLARVTSAQSADALAGLWDRHTTTEVTRG